MVDGEIMTNRVLNESWCVESTKNAIKFKQIDGLFPTLIIPAIRQHSVGSLRENVLQSNCKSY